MILWWSLLTLICITLYSTNSIFCCGFQSPSFLLTTTKSTLKGTLPKSPLIRHEVLQRRNKNDFLSSRRFGNNIQMAKDGDVNDTSSSSASKQQRRKKRKRKEQQQQQGRASSGGDSEMTATATTTTSTSAPPPPPPIELKPREDVPVQLEIKNVKDLVSGANSPSSKTPNKNMEIKSYTTNIEDNAITNPGTSSQKTPQQSNDSSFDQILEDVRRMQQEQLESKNDLIKNSDDMLLPKNMLLDEEGQGLKETVSNVLSTIVTIDFFIVCGFLVWFLLGIFCSSVLKNDTVQIAFNNNFETLVQPALGILMIAAIAGNFFKEDENPDMMV